MHTTAQRWPEKTYLWRLQHCQCVLTTELLHSMFEQAVFKNQHFSYRATVDVQTAALSLSNSSTLVPLYEGKCRHYNYSYSLFKQQHYNKKLTLKMSRGWFLGCSFM